MTDFDKISKQVAGVAERVADVADAAQGKGPRSESGNGRGGRWLILPAAGMALYAVVKTAPDLRRRAKNIARQARERAPETPDLDLLARVKEVTGLTDAPQRDTAQSSGSVDTDELERTRQERAERRERRSETIKS